MPKVRKPSQSGVSKVTLLLSLCCARCALTSGSEGTTSWPPAHPLRDPLGHSGAGGPAQSTPWPVATPHRAAPRPSFTSRRVQPLWSARAPASQRQRGGAAAQCRWMLDLFQLDRPALSAVGGAWQHAARCAFSSRCVASCRSCQRHAAIFGAGCSAAAGLVAAVVARGMQPADPWPVWLQVTRNVVRFGAVLVVYACRGELGDHGDIHVSV